MVVWTLLIFVLARGRQPFNEHVAHIVRIVNEYRKCTTSELKMDVMHGFMYYIVGQCAHKMWDRLKYAKHRVLLTGFFSKTLDSIQSPPSRRNPSDIAFLRIFRGHRGQIVRAKLKGLAERADVAVYLPAVRDVDFTVDLFPELLKLDPTTCHAVFTSSTCREFHVLLCLLLLGYRDALQHLVTLKQGSSPPEPRVLFRYINDVCDYLSLLHPIAHSAAASDYFISISRGRHRADGQRSSEDETPGADESDEHSGSDEEDDDELDGIGRQKRWLSLLVAQFSAIDLVLHFVNDVWTDNVTIKVVPTPPSEATLVPWELLVKDVVTRHGLGRGQSNGQNRLEAHQAWQAVENTRKRIKAFEHALTSSFTGRVHCESFLASMMFSRGVLSDGDIAVEGITLDEIQVRPYIFHQPAFLPMFYDSLWMRP
jgi:hypothetical protein